VRTGWRAEYSLPCSQEPTTAYPQPDLIQTVILSVLILSFHVRVGLPSGLSVFRRLGCVQQSVQVQCHVQHFVMYCI
jgi:hypothetical protein